MSESRLGLEHGGRGTPTRLRQAGGPPSGRTIAPGRRSCRATSVRSQGATTRCAEPLTAERLFGWHAALFPTGYSGMARIRVGAWRDDAAGPMQVVSGPLHRRTVHYQAPPADRLPAEMTRFLDWANADSGEPALLKAGLAHV